MVASALAGEVSWRARAGKLPYLRMFSIRRIRPTARFLPCCCGSPASVSRSRSELGVACIRGFARGTMPAADRNEPSIDPRPQQSIETGQVA